MLVVIPQVAVRRERLALMSVVFIRELPSADLQEAS